MLTSLLSQHLESDSPPFGNPLSTRLKLIPLYATALELLEPVLAKFGKDRLATAKADPDLDAIRDHPRFKAMIAAAEARLAQS